jgi:hypothetical protein
LQLDQCAEHGVWLDAGEIREALRSAEPSAELKSLIADLTQKEMRLPRSGK